MLACVWPWLLSPTQHYIASGPWEVEAKSSGFLSNSELEVSLGLLLPPRTLPASGPTSEMTLQLLPTCQRAQGERRLMLSCQPEFWP